MKIWGENTADTVFGYLREYGDVSFRESSMNRVDGLVLCLFAYLKFDGLVPDVREDKPSVTLADLVEHADMERLFADVRFEKDNRKLFWRMACGRRFRNMRMNWHVNIIEKERETQFSAITLMPEDGAVYVAFRGTDETLVGWKEGFNMGFLDQVPGQAMSVKYLNVVAMRFSGAFYVGGHSKGGNFAVYAAMNCLPCVQRRIRKVYNADGPGFRPEVLRECGYDRIGDRVEKFLPHASLVGMLFEEECRYQVVKSGKFWLVQHNPFHWKVRGGQFQFEKTVHAQARLADKAVNRWILLQERQQIARYVEVLYRVATASEAEDMIVFAGDWKKCVKGMWEALRGLDADSAKLLKTMLIDFGRTLRVCAREECIKIVDHCAGIRKASRPPRKKKAPTRRADRSARDRAAQGAIGDRGWAGFHG